VAAVGTVKSNEWGVLGPEPWGRVPAIGFKDGAVVGKGELLLTLDAAIQEAELQQAKANLALARSNHQRNEELLGRKFLSQQAVESSAATLRVQEAALQLAEAKVAKTRVKAPFKGVVARLQPHSYAGNLGYASAACLSDWIIVDMFASACVGQKTPKAAAARAEKRPPGV